MSTVAAAALAAVAWVSATGGRDYPMSTDPRDAVERSRNEPARTP
jgi:hypothetical protein